ncbi:DUF1007 family protein [Pseudoxanthobacter sp.]|uniref:HoxN/HupN/NixA family nickel/cobalt transporter n=1 Tax=Pseudoxanthobacter sp. TaxID=1925742 RepID=UPI002FE115C6
MFSQLTQRSAGPAARMRGPAAPVGLFTALLATLLAALFAATPAVAHPHVFVEAREDLVFDAEGRITAVRAVWRFDDGFSAFATQGLDANGDGELSQQELAPLAKVNVESLSEYRYFTFMDAGRERVRFAEPTQYWLNADDGRLTLFFTLPLKTPLDPAGRTVKLDVFDPNYFVAFTLTKSDPFALVPARAGPDTPAGVVPQGCSFSVTRPAELDPMTATTLALIPPEERDLPADLRARTEQLANTMTVTCPKKSAVAAPAPDKPAGAVRTVGASPFGVGLTESGGPPVGFLAVVASWQRAFYGHLTAALRAMKTDPRAGFLLMAVSFAYGVFHAAGPGHGKAVISAYLVSGRATARRAMVLSFLSALLQAVVAIAIVTVGALVFRATAFTMTTAAEWVEIASYGAILLLGLWLVWRKVVRPLGVWLAGRVRPAPAAGLLAATPAGAAPAALSALFGGAAGGEAARAGGGSGPALTAPALTAPALATPGLTDPALSAPAAAGGGRLRLKSHGAALSPDLLALHGADCDCGGHAVSPAAVAAGWRGAAGAVLASGLRPCTGALIVLVFALSQGLYAAGVAATLAMALGTGVTVTALALIAVGAKGLAMRLARREARLAFWLHRGVEALGAAVVLVFGFTLFAASLLPHLGR